MGSHRKYKLNSEQAVEAVNLLLKDDFRLIDINKYADGDFFYQARTRNALITGQCRSVRGNYWCSLQINEFSIKLPDNGDVYFDCDFLFRLGEDETSPGAQIARAFGKMIIDDYEDDKMCKALLQKLNEDRVLDRDPWWKRIFK